MKRISSKILSMLLACTMLLCLAPVAMASTSTAMPADYEYVIWSENFDGDTALDTTNTFTKSNFAHSFVNNRVELTYNPDAYTGRYPSNFLFVMKSGNSTAPVQSSGKTVSELSKMQVSFDIVASTSNQLSIAFRDQFSETAAAESYGVTSYIATMKTDGTISFMGSSSSYPYRTGDLLSFDVFFDFTGTSGKYSLYINNQMVVENANIDNASMKCVEALRFETSVKEKKETFTYGVDNIRFAIPEPLTVTSITPSNEEENVSLLPEVDAKFNYDIASVSEGTVAVTGGSTAAQYTASANGDTVRITFSEKLELNTEYTVTFLSGLTAENGMTLSESFSTTFTTTAQDLNSGYDSIVMEHKFEDLTPGKITSSTIYTMKTITEMTVAEISGRGNVMQFYGGAGRTNGFGIERYVNGTNTWDYPYGTNKLKIDLELKRNTVVTTNGNENWGDSVYLWAAAPSGGNTGLLMIWNTTGNSTGEYGKIKFLSNGTAGVLSEDAIANDTWCRITLYFDYAGKKYDAYLNGEYMGQYNVPTGTSLDRLYITGGKTTVSVDNISITTLPAFASPVISKYTDKSGNLKLGFFAKNTASSEMTYKILCAKYNGNDTLANVTISDGSVAASTREFEELTYPTLASDGSYYKYFIFDSMSNIVPLVESITIE